MKFKKKKKKLPNIIPICKVGIRNAYRILVGKSVEKITSRLKHVKVKVKLSLCLTKHHVMKAYWGSGGIAPSILDFGTRWR
jgi:hypothetical protein